MQPIIINNPVINNFNGPIYVQVIIQSATTETKEIPKAPTTQPKPVIPTILPRPSVEASPTIRAKIPTLPKIPALPRFLGGTGPLRMSGS